MEYQVTELINTILEWPLIIQGALGSGLFWLVLVIGQRISALSGKVISQRSTENEINYLRDLRDKYVGLKAHHENNVQVANYIATGIIYKSLRSLFKGLIWLALGLSFGSIIPVLGVVGFVGCLYHMFKGLAVVQEVDKSIPPADRIREIDEKLEQLEPNKSSNSDGVNAAGS
ncbi:hypothetical protein [Desulfoplanes formicivorans]|uniref:hypothetical protein n=1 Tax=Desulfoplanes formicivorans TaxID=1592317 RepID=UPI00114D190F|nr:hypothetical protein [Desulfoplanes formicivorans]